MISNKEHDVFISHASEDKTAFVEPLAIELRRQGLSVWFGKFSLRVGDSLHDSIEAGLAHSGYGIVVLSRAFLSKRWPRSELNGLFSREISGTNVILPIWHDITRDEIVAELPIIADRVSLNSSEGIGANAIKLLDVIRPDLLELDARKTVAQNAAQCLIEIAREKHPGYDFSVSSGVSLHPAGPNTIASLKTGDSRIDVSIADPALISGNPTVQVSFVGEGALKAIELIRTGKPQSWISGEIANFHSNVPLAPSSDVVKASSVEAALSHHLPIRFVRVTIGGAPPIIFPLMKMQLVRAGSEECEVRLLHTDTPLEIVIIVELNGSGSMQVTFNFAFDGYTFSQCRKVIDAMDRIRGEATLNIFDIQDETNLFNTLSVDGNFEHDPFSPTLRKLVSLCSQIESHFKVTLQYTGILSEQDSDSLFYLDCLLNGTPFGTNYQVTAVLSKGEGVQLAAQRIVMAGDSFTSFHEPSDYPGYIHLFGTSIETPAWGMVNACVNKKGAADLVAFDEASPGTEFSAEIVGDGPTYLRWKVEPDAAL